MNQYRIFAKLSFTAFALAAVLSTSSFSENAKVGAKAPDFTLTDSNGKKHSLKDFEGRVVVLEWLNHDCPFVQKHYGTGNMQKLQKTYGDKGVVWLSVNSGAKGNTAEAANKQYKEHKSNAKAVLLDADGVVGKKYGAETTPAMYVIDTQGTLVYMGAIDDKPTTDKDDIKKAKNYVAEALDAVLAKKPIKVASTKSYGCSVKY